jgi:hypothetical protein
MPQGRIVGAEAGPIGAETPPNVVAPANGGGGGVRVAPAKTVKEEDLTEREGKSLNFAIRMADSDNIANELEQEGVLTTDTLSNFFLGAVRAFPTVAGGNLAEQLESAFNATMGTLSPEEQRLGRAQLDFVTAVLRSESGAEIKTSEFPSEYRKYFAAAGDEKAVAGARMDDVDDFGERAVLQRGIELSAGDALFEPGVDFGTRIGMGDEPHFGLRVATELGSTMGGRMNLDGEIIAGIEDLHQQRKAGRITLQMAEDLGAMV